MGGITIEVDIMIGPKASIITESHQLNTTERKKLFVRPDVPANTVVAKVPATIVKTIE